jgi:hypothetical protein
MNRDQAVRRYGSHVALAKITGYSRQAHDISNNLRPVAQLLVFVDSDGALSLDKEIDDLVNKVLAVKLNQTSVVCAIERMVKQQQQASGCSCELFRLDGARILEEAIGAIK